jgi:hypothetical protein
MGLAEPRGYRGRSHRRLGIGPASRGQMTFWLGLGGRGLPRSRKGAQGPRSAFLERLLRFVPRGRAVSSPRDTARSAGPRRSPPGDRVPPPWARAMSRTGPAIAAGGHAPKPYPWGVMVTNVGRIPPGGRAPTLLAVGYRRPPRLHVAGTNPFACHLRCLT